MYVQVSPRRQSEKRDGRVHRVRTLPRCLHARRCCIPSLWCLKEVFPSPGRTWTSSWIFRDGALPPRFSPRSFLADRRTPASSQWHGPASKTARPSKFRFAIYVNAKTNVVGNVLVYSPSYALTDAVTTAALKKKQCRVALTELQGHIFRFARAVFAKKYLSRDKFRSYEPLNFLIFKKCF